jgi:ABC-type microcin C transport system duplicated ATPase subunit YejF
MQLSGAQMREVRGGDIGMIFQEPMTSLNPVLTIDRQITETFPQQSCRSDFNRPKPV